MARILVTGSAGLIGSHLVEHLMDTGNTVYGVDNLSVGSMVNVSKRAEKNFWHADLRHRKTVEFLMRIINPEIVYHCAAWAHEGLSHFSPQLITDNNLGIFMNVLVPSIRGNVKRFVTFSSIAAYGHGNPPFKEENPLEPVDMYGINKQFVEYTLKTLSDVHGIEYCIFRPYNVYGEGQVLHDPYRGVTAIFMNKILKGEPLVIFGDGEQQRSFTYIRDIIPAIANGGFYESAKNEVFNIGSDQVHTVKELAETIVKVSGGKGRVEYLPERAKEVKVAYSDCTKAKKILGLGEDTPFEEGLQNMWNWAEKQGYQEPKFLDYLELPSDKVPKNWLKK